jgi:hypothetical protein
LTYNYRCFALTTAKDKEVMKKYHSKIIKVLRDKVKVLGHKIRSGRESKRKREKENGKMGKWENGKMGKWENGKMGLQVLNRPKWPN